MTERRREIGACGNYCTGCLDYRTLASNDPELRKQAVAVIKNETDIDVPLDQVGCEGCWGGIHEPWCATVECGIRKCVDAKGYATCAECLAFPCDVYLSQFDKDSEFAKSILAIREDGLDKWIKSKQS